MSHASLVEQNQITSFLLIFQESHNFILSGTVVDLHGHELIICQPSQEVAQDPPTKVANLFAVVQSFCRSFP